MHRNVIEETRKKQTWYGKIAYGSISPLMGLCVGAVGLISYPFENNLKLWGWEPKIVSFKYNPPEGLRISLEEIRFSQSGEGSYKVIKHAQDEIILELTSTNGRYSVDMTIILEQVVPR